MAIHCANFAMIDSCPPIVSGEEGVVLCKVLRRAFLVAALLVTSGPATGLAVAGTYGPQACELRPDQGCETTASHKFDDNGAYAPNAPYVYVESFLYKETTGVRYDDVYGYGTAYKYWTENTTFYCHGWWVNAAGGGSNTAYVINGTFHY